MRILWVLENRIVRSFWARFFGPQSDPDNNQRWALMLVWWWWGWWVWWCVLCCLLCLCASVDPVENASGADVLVW